MKPLGWYRDSPTLTDVDVKYLLLYFEENYGLTVEKKIIDAVAVIANENRYHPVCDFLNGLQWDGTERIRYCLHRFLGSDTDDYTYEALKLFLLGAISRAFKPGDQRGKPFIVCIRKPVPAKTVIHHRLQSHTSLVG